jgi:hypothetical protein
MSPGLTAQYLYTFWPPANLCPLNERPNKQLLVPYTVVIDRLVFRRLRKTEKSLTFPSIRPHGTRLQLDGFSRNLVFSIFRKCVNKIQISLNSDNNNGYFTWKRVTFMIVCFWIILKGRNIWDKYKRKTKHISCSITFFLENRAVYEIVWKNVVQTGHRWQLNTAHVLCMLDT